jgi:RNA polymerase sigma factor (sigma-70 family)
MQSRGSLDDLYRKHGGSVLRRAKQLLGTEHEATEVLQELFMSLVEKPSQLDQARSVTGWLYGATTHACLNRLRNAKNRNRLVELHVVPMQEETSPTALDDRTAARDLLAKMPDELAHAATYYYFDELSQQEIAQMMGCSRSHVGNLLERVRTWARSQENAA